MIIAYPGSNFSRNVHLFLLTFLLIGSCFFNSARAHLELYHNVEVNLTETAETGIVRLYFTIHAPELLVGFENAGSDVFDARWLRTRSDEEYQTLFEQGRIFVKEKFGFRIDSGSELDLSDRLRFEKPEMIRSESYQSGVPVGCLLVSAELTLNAGAKQLGVSLAPDAGKRLLLVCTRKGAFPEVADMDGGSSVTLAFPERNKIELLEENVASEPSITGGKFLWPWILGFAVLFVAVILWRLKSQSR